MTTRAIQWSAPSEFSVVGVHHGYRTAPGTLDDLGGLDVPSGVVRVWFGMLEPGGFIVPHIDKSPWFRRWHYPIEPAGYLWQNGSVTEPTELFEIRHHEPHAVWNPTEKRRVHLIVETEEQIPGDSGLVLCDLIEVANELWDEDYGGVQQFPQLFTRFIDAT